MVLLTELKKRANLPHITVHDGRHTFAARTRQAGIPLEDIKDFLGHKDVSTTQVYAHISPEVKKRSMNQLENYIEEANKKALQIECFFKFTITKTITNFI